MESVAEASSAKPLIYHLEGIRAILDSPRGYGMRLEYLRGPMKPEEQVSFVSQFSSELSAAIGRQSSMLADLAGQVAEIHAAVTGRGGPPLAPNLNLAATIATRATPIEALKHSDKEFIRSRAKFITENLDIGLLCYLHRSAMEEHEIHVPIGDLRRVGVWIGNPGSTPETARYVPPDPTEVPGLVDQLLSNWRSNYDHTIKGDEAEKIKAIVSFHHEFLRIHPFLDGNGRVARILLEQQAMELLGIKRRITLNDSLAYFEALQAAHAGDFHH